MSARIVPDPEQPPIIKAFPDAPPSADLALTEVYLRQIRDACFVLECNPGMKEWGQSLRETAGNALQNLYAGMDKLRYAHAEVDP
jgi:hypothetical protein